MARTKRPTAVRLARLPEVSERYLRGEKQNEIAAALGVTQSTISRDLKYLYDVWLENSSKLVGEAMALELARIDNLERVAWREYERSKEPAARRKSGFRDKSDGREVVAETVTTERLGNPRYLATVQWCIEQRCKILGVYAAEAVTGDILVRFVYGE